MMERHVDARIIRLTPRVQETPLATPDAANFDGRSKRDRDIGSSRSGRCHLAPMSMINL